MDVEISNICIIFSNLSNICIIYHICAENQRLAIVGNKVISAVIDVSHAEIICYVGIYCGISTFRIFSKLWYSTLTDSLVKKEIGIRMVSKVNKIHETGCLIENSETYVYQQLDILSIFGTMILCDTWTISETLLAPYFPW